MGRPCSEPELDQYCLQLEAGGRRGDLLVVLGIVRKRHVQRRTVGSVSDGLGRIHLHAAVVASVLSGTGNQSETGWRRINTDRNCFSRFGKRGALTETSRSTAASE